MFDNFPCIMVNVYAPNEVASRRDLWEELVGLKANFIDPWCIRGDFDEIKVVYERVGCLRVDKGMKDFLEFSIPWNSLIFPCLTGNTLGQTFKIKQFTVVWKFLCSQD